MRSLSASRLGSSVMISRFVLAAFLCAGIAGNYLRYNIFFNIEFIFGSIFAMLILQLFGLGWGVFSGLIISVVTWHLWNHPYAIVIMTAEVLVVGLIVLRRKAGLVLADALYWLFIGMPLVVLFYSGVMHLPLYASVTTMLKQAVNGVANALVARLLFFAFSPRLRREPLSMREIMFDLLVLFSLFPALFLTAGTSGTELRDIEQSARRALTLSSQRVEREINQWIEHHLLRVEHLAWMAARMPVPMIQKSIEHTLEGDKDFLRIGLLDASATVVAYSPLLDELGRKNIGRNFKDRPFIPVLKRTLSPMLSEVVMGRMGAPKPMVTALAPVVAHGRYAGYVTGILDLNRLDAMISFASQGSALLEREYFLLDRNRNIITSSRKSAQPMQPYARESGQIITLDTGVKEWVPTSAKNISLSDRWKRAVYFIEVPIGGISGWNLILEQPLAPYQKRLYARYSVELVWIFGILLLALLTAEIISKKMTAALEMLGAHSAGLPEKLVRGESLTLPSSGIRETQQLIRNIDEMSEELSRKFNEVKTLNAELEARVAERTRELQVSEERFRSLVESSSDWIWEVDENARYTYCSPQVRDVLGYEPHEVVGRTPFDFMSPAEAQRVSEEFNVFGKARQAIISMENVNLHKDGHGVVLETSGVPIIDAEGRLTGYRGIDRDITERRRAEEEIRRLAKEQKIILNTVAVGIAFVRGRKVVWANAGYERLFGLGSGEAKGMDTRLVYVHSGDYERVGREGYDLLNAGGIYSIEIESARRDGSPFWLSLTGRAVDVGRPDAGSIWILQDITERKQAADALRRSEERLNRAQHVAKIGNWEWNLATNEIEWSDEVYRLYGIDASREKPSYAVVVEALAPECRDQFQKSIEESLNLGRHFEGEYRLILRDGTVRYTHTVGEVRRDASGLPITMFGVVQDITERKVSEERFRQLANEQRLILETIAIGIVFAKNRKIFWANPAFEKIYGFDPGEFLSRDTSQLYADEADYERVGREGYPVIATGATYSVELAANRKDGGRRWIHLTGRAVNPANPDEGSIWMFQDITERKATETALATSEKKYRSLIENLQEGIWMINKDGNTSYVNQPLARMLGYTIEEMMGRHLFSFMDARGKEQAAQFVARRREGVAEQHEFEFIRKDGKRIYAAMVTSPIMDEAGKYAGALAGLIDITDRKEAEEALRESERLFRESIEFMPVPIGIANPDGSIRAYNKSFVETYGYTIRDIPTIEAWIQTAYPDAAYRERNREVWSADVEQAMREGGSTPIREYEVTCRNGRVKNVEITMRPIGPLFIATFYDVTARKRIEKDLIEKTLQLEDLTKNLEQRVQEEIALRSRNEQMLVQQSKLAAMGEMLGAIAHQWRQPLNALGLIIQNLGDMHRYGELDTASVEKSVRQSMAHVQHMSETIDDFRSFFQPDKERTTFDAMQAVSEVLDLFSAQLESNDITYRLACHTHGKFFDMHTPVTSCPEKTVEGYRNEFEHVILNLVNNSRDAILARRAAGGAAQGMISFDFYSRDDKVIVSVSDNGGGIDPGIIDRIFEPYFTTKHPTGGTGLGLYMAKVIIEKHLQGTLSVENRGEGALFTIELQQAGAGRS